MCGVAGVYYLDGPDRPVDAEMLKAMIRPLAHRGPDGVGLYAGGGIGLAHARLSIIDLTGGKQPIGNEDGAIKVVFNGEIFNYLELRRELESAGHVFRTQSDTEVIPHLYEEHGKAFVDHLNGQFSIALWDGRRHRLILVRDRVGITPLFYTEDSGRLFFASEIKSILPVRSRTPEPNMAALDQIMTYWAPVSPNTMFAGIQELPPGHLLVAESGKVPRVARYWDWDFSDPGSLGSASEGQLAEELESLLVDAVGIRLRADVPVGAYLSGGLDSSTIAALIHDSRSAPLKTFSIGFEQSDYDESHYQRQMVAHLGTDHRAFTCGLSDIADVFPDTIWHAEAPVLRTAPAPMQLLSGHVRGDGFKVVLTGEGADEVLGGYDIFKEAKIRRFWSRNPDSSFRPALLKRLYPYLNLGGGQSIAYLKQFFGRGLEEPDSPWFSHIPRWSTTAAVKNFFSEEMRAHLTDNFEAVSSLTPPAFASWHWFEKAQYLEAKTLMSGYLLCSQGDRMLMANSVEGRYPFLDHRIIEFANRVRPALKMRGLTEKYLLKKAVGRYLPKSIAGRTKQPYRAPEAAPFVSESVPDYARDLLDTAVLKRFGYFDAERVDRLKRKMARGTSLAYKDNMALVGILSTQLWHHLYVENAVTETEFANLQGNGEHNVHRA